jgi:hypothetical protein
LPRALEEAWDRVGKELCARHFFVKGLGLGSFLAFGRFRLLLMLWLVLKDFMCVRRFSKRMAIMHVGGNDDEMRIFVFMHWCGFGDGVAGKGSLELL